MGQIFGVMAQVVIGAAEEEAPKAPPVDYWSKLAAANEARAAGDPHPEGV